MQSKSDKFNELPLEVKFMIAEKLPNRAIVNLCMVDQYHLSLFKPMVAVLKLLHHVTRGEHDAVKAMLKQDMTVIFKRGKVKDCSGREFGNISGFEYALWALDKHMWAAMIECIPSNDEGKKVFAQLIAQYNKVDTDGVTYRLNGETITEKHFDFENTLIKELQTQVDSMHELRVKDPTAIDKQWREGVGDAQTRLPMHVVFEYCSDEPFYPVPEFTSQPKLSKQFYNSACKEDENWFSADSKLSVDFAIHKGRGTASSAVYHAFALLYAGRDDLPAMRALYKVRTKDFTDLKSQLEDQITLDNHHQMSHI